MNHLTQVLIFAAISLGLGIPDSGVCVVEFNASFNAANSVGWIDDLSDCKGRRVDIASEPAMQSEYKIVVVPTVIVFNEGEEVKRFQANIMMQLEASKSDVQDAVDEILMSDF
jgi:predicted nucleotidyltransferase|tara:strand:- start:1260 stop:1598 length:339 start_codon:yes stop_codon:yes gene_type:complete